MCPSQTHRIHIVIRLIEASKKASFTIGGKILEICANEVYEWSQRCFLIAEFRFIVKALMQSHSFSKRFLLSKESLFLDSFCKILFQILEIETPKRSGPYYRVNKISSRSFPSWTDNLGKYISLDLFLAQSNIVHFQKFYFNLKIELH